MIKTLLRHVKRYRTAAVLTPVFTALEVLLDVLIPFVTASIIDKGINAGDINNVYFYGTILLVLAALSFACGVLSGRYGAYASSGFAANLRAAMYRNIQTFSFSNIDKYSTSGLITRMTTDVTTVQDAFQTILRIAVRSPFTLISSVVMCVVINPKMSLIFLVALVVLSVILFLIISRVAKVFRQVFAQYDVLNQTVQENVTGMRVVKAFVREEHENAKFSRAAERLYRLYLKAEGFMAVNHPVMNLVVYGCIIALSWFGAKSVVGGTLTTGELTSLFTYVMSIMMSLMMLSMVFVRITMSATSGARIAEVLNETPDIQNPESPITEIADGSIDFDDVCFAYQGGSGEYALRNCNLHIASGETLGVIGGTGSGKSSLVNLVSRLYDVSRGTLSIGGVDVRNYDIESLRNEVSVVLQSNVLFTGTILENLRWGNPNATLEECRQACRWACADEFIEQMPDGYNTHIEQGGANVSGGQKQRLCIARALLKRPKVLVLDDSTSACDNATDAKIRKAFREEIPKTTTIIISQRISSVRDCDRIVVMDGGEVKGCDTHDNLLKTNKIYKEIYDLQTSGGGDFDEVKKPKKASKNTREGKEVTA